MVRLMAGAGLKGGNKISRFQFGSYSLGGPLGKWVPYSVVQLTLLACITSYHLLAV